MKTGNIHAYSNVLHKEMYNLRQESSTYRSDTSIFVKLVRKF